MWISEDWKDYELLDAANGKRLERWGETIFIRPDPTAMWTHMNISKQWAQADGEYFRSTSGGGSWKFYNKIPEKWKVSYKNIKFEVKPMGFKHMGVFPEQAVNWEYIMGSIKSVGRKIKVLNLFAYTGGATLAAASAGAEVCHVDAAKAMVQTAKLNAEHSGLEDASIRYIVDDCIKFVSREIRRGNKYDAIILDPPSYGRGPNGEVWKVETHLVEFLELCSHVLSDDPLFIILNSYTAGLSAACVENLLKLTFKQKAAAREIGLPISSKNIFMPSGVTGRVTYS